MTDWTGVARGLDAGLRAYVGTTGVLENVERTKAERELIESRVRERKRQEQDELDLRRYEQEATGVQPVPVPSPVAPEAAPAQMPSAQAFPVMDAARNMPSGSAMAAQGVEQPPPLATPGINPAEQKPSYFSQDMSRFEKMRARATQENKGHLLSKIDALQNDSLKSELERFELTHKQRIAPMLAKYNEIKTEGDLKKLPMQQRLELMTAQAANAELTNRAIALGYDGLLSPATRDTAIKFFNETGFILPGVEVDDFKFERGTIGSKGDFQKDPKGTEYVIGVDKNGDVVKTKTGKPVMWSKADLDALRAKYIGGKVDVHNIPKGGKLAVTDARGNLIRTIDNPDTTERKNVDDARVTQAVKLIETGLGLKLDPTGKLMATVGLGEMQKSVDLAAEAGALIRQGMTPEAAAQKVMDQYRREKELAPKDGGYSGPRPWAPKQ